MPADPALGHCMIRRSDYDRCLRATYLTAESSLFETRKRSEPALSDHLSWRARSCQKPQKGSAEASIPWLPICEELPSIPVRHSPDRRQRRQMRRERRLNLAGRRNGRSTNCNPIRFSRVPRSTVLRLSRWRGRFAEGGSSSPLPCGSGTGGTRSLRVSGGGRQRE